MRRGVAKLSAALVLTLASATFAQDHVDAPRNAAEAALVGAAHYPGAQRAFEVLFMDTSAYLRIEPETYAAIQQARAEGRSLEEINPRFWVVEPEPGVRAIGVYLSEQAFNNHHNGHYWVRLSGRNLLAFAKANGLGVWITDAGVDGERSDGHSALWNKAEVDMVLSRNPSGAAAASQ